MKFKVWSNGCPCGSVAPPGLEPRTQAPNPEPTLCLYLFIHTEVTKASGWVLRAQIFVLAALSWLSVGEVTLKKKLSHTIWHIAKMFCWCFCFVCFVFFTIQLFIYFYFFFKSRRAKTACKQGWIFHHYVQFSFFFLWWFQSDFQVKVSLWICIPIRFFFSAKCYWYPFLRPSTNSVVKTAVRKSNLRSFKI